MLKQVTLQVNENNPFKSLSEEYQCEVNVVSCKDSIPGEISLLLEVTGDKSEELIKVLRAMKGVTKVYSAPSSKVKECFVAVVVMDSPAYCGIAQASGIFCLMCPYSSTSSQGEKGLIPWKILVKDLDSMQSALSALDSRQRERTNITEVSNFGVSNLLTPRQREVLMKASQLGYFEFPRKYSLTEIAQKMSISPATLSEILRSAEAKVMDYYANSLFKDHRNQTNPGSNQS